MHTHTHTHTLLPPASGGGPGRATLPALGTSATWKAALWTRLDKLANSIHKAYNQVRGRGKQGEREVGEGSREWGGEREGEGEGEGKGEERGSRAKQCQ